VKPEFAPDEDLPWLRAIVHGLARDGLASVTSVEDGHERVALP
jgi:hypothetical protein